METIELKAEARAAGGKGRARALRRSGKIPAILYGPGRSPVPLAVDAKDFEHRIASVEGSHLVRWEGSVPEVGGKLALVKDIQLDPISGRVVHTDLYEVDENKAIHVKVPLHFIGRAAGMDNGGILQPVIREIEVSCLPAAIPDFIEIDVTRLGIHDAIHMNEITPPPGVTLTSTSDEPVVTVLPPTVEEVKTQSAEATATGTAAPAAAAPAAPAKAAGGKSGS